MTSQIRVFSMLHQPLLELGLAQALEGVPGCAFRSGIRDADELADVLGSISDASESDSPRPVLVLGYDADHEAMRRVVQHLRNRFRGLRLLVFLPVVADRDVVVAAMRWGADAYLLHTATQESLAQAIVELARGRSYLETRVTPVVLEEMRRPVHALVAATVDRPLTERDRMLLQLAADGLSNQQIAGVLGIAEKTVRNAWSQLFERIGMTDRTQAVMWAIRSGHVELR
ncbi:MAG: response regulator transcription factor [Alicyclobacillus sp.]|nr:response regulator transcription factor [Alicyclobacillus sp.]